MHHKSRFGEIPSIEFQVLRYRASKLCMRHRRAHVQQPENIIPPTTDIKTGTTHITLQNLAPNNTQVNNYNAAQMTN